MVVPKIVATAMQLLEHRLHQVRDGQSFREAGPPVSAERTERTRSRHEQYTTIMADGIWFSPGDAL
jgi:hypothetical protein